MNVRVNLFIVSCHAAVHLWGAISRTCVQWQVEKGEVPVVSLTLTLKNSVSNIFTLPPSLFTPGEFGMHFRPENQDYFVGSQREFQWFHPLIENYQTAYRTAWFSKDET